MADRWRLRRHPDAVGIVARRAAVLSALRAWLDGHGLLEVDLPVLAPHAGQEPHLRPPRVELDGLPGPLYLQTSPELAAKRLVCAGCASIYSLGPVFRGGRDEWGPQHQPQFTLLEWYRPGTSTDDLVEDVVGLVGAACSALGRGPPPRPHPRSVSMSNAFDHLAGVPLEPLLDGDAAAFVAAAHAAGLSSADTSQDVATLFGRVLVERIEPELTRVGGLVFLHGWPAFGAGLAKLSAADPRTADRVEAYVDGVEIANGYVELDDPDEMAARWEAEAAERAAAAGHAAASAEAAPPMDLALLDEMRADGLPPTVGMALGVDRLIMALTGAASLADVLPLHLDLEADPSTGP